MVSINHAISPCQGICGLSALWGSSPSDLSFQLILFQEVTTTFCPGNTPTQVDCPSCFAPNNTNFLFCPMCGSPKHEKPRGARQSEIDTTPLESRWKALEDTMASSKYRKRRSALENEFMSFLERLSPLNPWIMSHLETLFIFSSGKTRIQKLRYTRSPALTKAPTPNKSYHASVLVAWRSKPSTLI